jgi:hypothetical protein
MEEFADSFTSKYKRLLRQAATDHTPEEIRKDPELKEKLEYLYHLFVDVVDELAEILEIGGDEDEEKETTKEEESKE